MDIEAIGRVASSRKEPLDDDWDKVTATITLDADKFTPQALWGLDEFSHLEVVYLFDQVDPRTVQTAARHPRGNGAVAKGGNLRPAGQRPPQPAGRVSVSAACRECADRHGPGP